MASLTKQELASLVANYLKTNKISIVGFEATSDNCLELLDKIGQIKMIDGVYETNLDWMNGENLPLGKTIEEYFEDFIPAEDYSKDSGSANFEGEEIGHRPVRYSYTQGRKKWKVKKYYNDLERAFSTEEGAIQALLGITERLESSYLMWRDDVKKGILGALADKVDAVYSDAKTYTAKTAYSVGDAVKAGDEYGIVFKALKTTDNLTWANAIKAGYISPVSLRSSLTEPTDALTGEDFIVAVKKAVRIMKFKNHENLNGALVKPTPTANRRLIVRSDVMPFIEVKTEAGAFQLDKLALPAAISEVDDFGEGHDDIIAILVDDRGEKLHNSYNATRTQPLADEDSMLYVKHTEDTAFISANTFVHVFKKAA